MYESVWPPSKSKQDELIREATSTRDDVANKVNATSSSFNNINEEKLKVDGKNLTSAAYNRVNKSTKAYDMNKSTKAYDMSKGYNGQGTNVSQITEKPNMIQNEVGDYQPKEHGTTLPPITEGADFNRRTNSKNPRDSLNELGGRRNTKGDTTRNRTLYGGDKTNNRQIDDIYRTAASEISENRQTTSKHLDNKIHSKIQESATKISPYNLYDGSINGDHSNQYGPATQTPRDSHGNSSNKMDKVNKEPPKQNNGYHKTGVKKFEGNSDRRINEKHAETSHGVQDINSNSKFANSQDGVNNNIEDNRPGKINNSVVRHQDVSRNNNNNNNTNKDQAIKSTSLKPGQDNLSHEKHNKEQTQHTDNNSMHASSQHGDLNWESKVDRDEQMNQAQTTRRQHRTNEKEFRTTSPQSHDEDENSNSRVHKNITNHNLTNSMFRNDANTGKIKAKQRKGERISNNERGGHLSNERKLNDADRQRLEYVRNHYGGTFERYSDHEDDTDDQEVDTNTVAYNTGRRAVFRGSQDVDDGDDDDDGDDEHDYSDGEMLDQSTAELKATIDNFERSYDTIENEGNEWKTRFETQTEMNQQLEKQILLLQEKVEEAKRNLKEAGKSPRDNRSFDDFADASPQMVKALERERLSLFSQLRDLEWRLDQESKAYHKANDERKQYVLEINATKVNIGELKSKQRQTLLNAQEAPPRITARSHPGDSPRTYRDTGGNIREDQRILDPRYGPIRKTAAIKALPSLD